MKITVEFLLDHTNAVYSVGRVPCVGEIVALDLDFPGYEVKEVIHLLQRSTVLEDRIMAIVRVA